MSAERLASIRIFTTLIALLGASTSPHAQTATLRFGEIPSSAHGMTSLNLFIAERQGFFARENVTLDIVPIAGGTGNMVAALDRGEVDVTQTATPYLIQAVLNGSQAVAIAGEIANPIYSLIAKPKIKNFADLKGKLIGLSLPVDTISISTRKLLALKGLSDGDYRVKELVGTPARAACLKSGECDAVPLGQPDDLVAVKEGYRRLGVSTEAVASFQFDVIATRRDFAETHAPAIIGFVARSPTPSASFAIRRVATIRSRRSSRSPALRTISPARRLRSISIPIAASCRSKPKSTSTASPR